MFRLLGFAKLSRKNRAGKNLRRSSAIAKSQTQRRSALFIAQNCTAKNLRRSGAIAKPTLNIGQQQLPGENRAAKNFRRSGAIAKPKIKHKSATITAQGNAAKNLWRNREAQNEARVSNHYHAHESVQPTQNTCSSHPTPIVLSTSSRMAGNPNNFYQNVEFFIKFQIICQCRMSSCK